MRLCWIMFLPSFLVLDSHNNIYIAMEIMAEKNEKLDPRSFIAIGDTLSNISSFCDCLLGVDIMCSMLLCPINLFCTTFFSYFGVWETINDSCSSSYSVISSTGEPIGNWFPQLIMMFVCLLSPEVNKVSSFCVVPLPGGCGWWLQGPDADKGFTPNLQ